MSQSLNDYPRATASGSNLPKGAQSLLVSFKSSTEGIDEFFDPPLESKYECPICLLGLKEPVQTQCGHRFCRNCITRSLRESGNKCPVDNEPLSESGLYPDNFAKREMGSFTVLCKQKDRGCKYKGTLNEYLSKHKKFCDYGDVFCPNKCGVVTQLKDIEAHMNICPKRKKVCDYCEKLVLFSEIKAHYKECPKYKVSCPKCKEKVPNEELENHKQRFCSKEKIKCPLHFIGCKEENYIPEINKHLTTNVVNHIHDLAMAVKKLQEGKSIELTESKPGSSASSSSAEEKSNSSHLLQPEVKRITEKLVRLENRVIDLEGRVCNGTFIWKIENYEHSRLQAISNTMPAIHSPPFYTSMHGYKMCLRMNLNGVDTGINRHISLFVHMMQGEWDDILEWPFTGRITLAILDQSDNVEFRRPISETLVAKPNLLAFQKPTSIRNHKGYGYVEFCQIDQLLPDQFVKNNSVLVRIQVFH